MKKLLVGITAALMASQAMALGISVTLRGVSVSLTEITVWPSATVSASSKSSSGADRQILAEQGRAFVLDYAAQGEKAQIGLELEREVRTFIEANLEDQLNVEVADADMEISMQTYAEATTMILDIMEQEDAQAAASK